MLTGRRNGQARTALLHCNMIGQSVIGPAEIDEMMAEYAETIAWTGAGEPVDATWPLFVREHHLDEAGRQLIGNQAGAVVTCPKAAG